MEEKEVQLLFKKNIEGNFIIPLKDGKIIIYYFREDYNIHIYNEKTFQKLFDINLYYSIIKFKETIKKNDESLFDFYHNKNCIKELENGLILLGLDKYLMKLKLNKKDYDIKVIKKLDDIILDVNELSNKIIIIITNKNIIQLEEKNEEYIVVNEYSLKENWKIVPKSLTGKSYEDFHQYYSSYVLPNSRLLLNSFSTELSKFRLCSRQSPIIITDSKIIFIDLNNFEEISSTEIFETNINYIILENYIIIHSYENFIIYDINSLKQIQNIQKSEIFGYWRKLNNQELIEFSRDINGNKTINIYKINNKDNNNYNLIEPYKIKIDINNIDKYSIRLYLDKLYYNGGLITLRDNRIIILCDDEIYVLQLI